MSEIMVKDIVNGAEGACYSVINGQQELMAYVKKIEAKVEKIKSEIKVLGSTATKHKAVGWNGTGSMNIYYVTSTFRKMMLEYMKTGKDLYFDIVIENTNPNSNMGRQSMVLHNVNINSVILAKLDIDSTELDEDVEFTFDGADMLDEFNQLVLE